MSCRGRRAAAHERIVRFEWHDGGEPFVPALVEPAPDAVPAGTPAPAVEFAVLEREAFAAGFAQGERSGAEASSVRIEAVLSRLTHTIEDLGRVRSAMIRKTERQVVQLALAIATRIVRREIAMDRELLCAMARVALDRLGDSPSARIRLHPEDCAAIRRLGSGPDEGGAVQVVSDAAMHRGGCVVESDFGLIDIGVDAQIGELTRSLFADEDSFEPVPIPVLTGHAAHTNDR